MGDLVYSCFADKRKFWRFAWPRGYGGELQKVVQGAKASFSSATTDMAEAESGQVSKLPSVHTEGLQCFRRPHGNARHGTRRNGEKRPESKTLKSVNMRRRMKN
jgi:hypothetical protein